jgi:putative ABC transport system permease protein
MDAVLGASVARAIVQPGHEQSALVGATFIGTHGLGAGGHAHGEHPYRVSGVLQPCGCVLDRLILTSSESVWLVHETATADDPEDLEILKQEREVTVALVRYRTPLAAVSLPRSVNANTSMQAAAPAMEISRLLRLLGVGADVLRAFGGVLLAVAALSVFIALWNAVRERRFDLAMLRMLGAPPGRVAGLVLCEALWLAVLASGLGLLLGHGLAHAMGWALQAQGLLPVTGALWLPEEAGVPLLAGLVAAVAALLPAMQAYRTDVADLLVQP